MVSPTVSLDETEKIRDRPNAIENASNESSLRHHSLSTPRERTFTTQQAGVIVSGMERHTPFMPFSLTPSG
ncbi:hypothetical protein HY522_07065 [bacterium]|nr:hypothetical protein [bacterium]